MSTPAYNSPRGPHCLAPGYLVQVTRTITQDTGLPAIGFRIANTESHKIIPLAHPDSDLTSSALACLGVMGCRVLAICETVPGTYYVVDRLPAWKS